MRGPIERLFPNVSRRQRAAIDWLATIVVAVLIVLALKAWVVNPYRIPSASMEPTLHCGRPGQGCEAGSSDRVLANRFIYHFRDPERGEIVVFNAPKRAATICNAGVYVKRTIGLPGDRWEERNGYVYIDGKRLDEPYVRPDRRDAETRTLADIPPRGRYTRIPKDMYLMMGDNRRQSCDSRRWGLVARSALIGEVFLTYWPLNRISTH
jgi:signal peptidase I